MLSLKGHSVQLARLPVSFPHSVCDLCLAVSTSKRPEWPGLRYVSGVALDTAVNTKTVACLESFPVRCG